MATTIGYTDGITATKERLENLDPAAAEVAYANQANTLKQLKQGHNEVWRDGGIADRVTKLEEALQGIPFVPSSTV
jgi:hypothetical protein